MIRMKKAITAMAALALVAGCTGLRDLYEERRTELHVVSLWNEALDGPTMDATMLLYGNGTIVKEFYQRMNGVSAQVSAGRYDVVLFNGVMESEQNTNLDHIYMRGTNSPATFEVCAAEVKPSRRIARAEGEYIANPNMSLFAFARGEVDIIRANGLLRKYNNGRRVADDGNADNEVRVEFSPRAYSYRFCVRMTGVGNPHSAQYMAGAVRGFAGSVFPAASDDGVPRMGFPATYHLSFPNGTSRTRSEGEGKIEIGTLESSVFTTFGPALAAAGEKLPASGRYFFDPVFVLADKDKTEFRLAAPIDITRQVNEISAVIAEHHRPGGHRITYEKNLFIIEIPDAVELPKIKSDNGNGNGNQGGGPVTVNGWGPDEPAIVWI